MRGSNTSEVIFDDVKVPGESVYSQYTLRIFSEYSQDTVLFFSVYQLTSAVYSQDTAVL